MNVHKNARTTPHGRDLMVRRVLDEGRTPASVATEAGVSVRTVYKWLARYRAEGRAGLDGRPVERRRPAGQYGRVQGPCTTKSRPLTTAEACKRRAVAVQPDRIGHRPMTQETDPWQSSTGMPTWPPSSSS